MGLIAQGHTLDTLSAQIPELCRASRQNKVSLISQTLWRVGFLNSIQPLELLPDFYSFSTTSISCSIPSRLPCLRCQCSNSLWMPIPWPDPHPKLRPTTSCDAGTRKTSSFLFVPTFLPYLCLSARLPSFSAPWSLSALPIPSTGVLVLIFRQ
jgi:hypothetical protein